MTTAPRFSLPRYRAIFATGVPIGTLGSEGEYGWGGAAGTRFWIEPRGRLIGIFMIQILPHTGLTFGNEFKVQVEQALISTGRPMPTRVRRSLPPRPNAR